MHILDACVADGSDHDARQGHAAGRVAQQHHASRAIDERDRGEGGDEVDDSRDGGEEEARDPELQYNDGPM